MATSLGRLVRKVEELAVRERMHSALTRSNRPFLRCGARGHSVARWAMAVDRLLDRARRNHDVAHPSRHADAARRCAALTSGALAVGLLQAPGQAAPGGRRPATPGSPGLPGRRAAHRSERVADLLGRMTLAEKIGQMTQAERIDVDADPTLITTYGLGSVLSGGGSTPAPATRPRRGPTWSTATRRRRWRPGSASRCSTASTRCTATATSRARRSSRTTSAWAPPATRSWSRRSATSPRGDPGDRPAVGVRAVRLRGPRRPLGPHLRELRRGPASWSTQMETAIDGLQGDGRRDLDDAGPGAGQRQALRRRRAHDVRHRRAATTPSTRASTRSRRAEFDKLALAPYVPAIQQAPRRLGDAVVLQRRLDRGRPRQPGQDARQQGADHRLAQGASSGFDGFVISDWRAIHQLPGDYADQVRASVNAGVDMFMEPIQAPNNPDGWDDFIPHPDRRWSDSGEVPMSRIDDAVTRILTAKFELGLFEHPLHRPPQHRHDRQQGAPRGRPPGRRRVAGAAASNRQPHAAAERRATAARLRRRQQRRQHRQPGRRLDADLAGRLDQRDPGPDRPGRGAGDVAARGSSSARRPPTRCPASAAGIVVVGETPYAEGFGDVNGPQWAYDPGDNGVPRPKKTMQLSDADQLAIRQVCARPASCTVLVVSGRPMIIPPELLAQIDALVASWLPGSEGMGVADVLFGTQPFTGKLPVTWPRTVAQEPINVGDADYDPLYRYGFGLRHALDAPDGYGPEAWLPCTSPDRSCPTAKPATSTSSTAGSPSSRRPAPRRSPAAGWCPGWSTRTATSASTSTARSTARPPRRRRSPTATPARCCCATAAARPTPAGSRTATTCRG